MRAVRVKANLPQTSTVIGQFLLQMYNKKMFDLENESQSDEAQHSQFDGKYMTSYLMATVMFSVYHQNSPCMRYSEMK